VVESPSEGFPGPLPTGQPEPGAELVAHPREGKCEVYRGGRFDGKPDHTHRTSGASAIDVPANLHGDVGTGRASASVEDDPTLCKNSREGWRDRFSDRLRHMERLGVKLRLKHHLSQQLTHFGGTARGRGMGRKRINTFGS